MSTSSSGNRRSGAVLRTYSKRVNPNHEVSSSKKRRISKADDVESSSQNVNSEHLDIQSSVIQGQGPDEDISLARYSPIAVTVPPHSNKKFRSFLQSSGVVPSTGPLFPTTGTLCESMSGDISSGNSTSTHSSQQPVAPGTISNNSMIQGPTQLYTVTRGRLETSQPASSTTQSPLTAVDFHHPQNAALLASVSSGGSSAENGTQPHSSPRAELWAARKEKTQDPCTSSFTTKSTPPENDASSDQILRHLTTRATTATTVTTRKRRNEVLSDTTPEAIGRTPTPKKQKLLGIQNYFKPLPRSSSPSISQSAVNSSDSIEAPENFTPPSSPPPAETALFTRAKKPQKRQPRRLTTKPTLEPLDSMSSRRPRSAYLSDEDRPSFSEVAGRADDSSGVPLVEEYLDQDEKDDLRRSEMVRDQNRPRSYWYPPSYTGNSAVNSETGSLPNLPAGGMYAVRPPASRSLRPRGVSQPLIGGIRDDRASGPSLHSSSRHASFSQAGASSVPNGLTRYSSARAAIHLYDHEEEHEPQLALTQTSRALSERTRYDQNLAPYQPSHTMPIPMVPKKKNETTGYHQLQLELGLGASITCAICRMFYNPSDPMDRRAHDEFCRSTSLPMLPRYIANSDRALCEKIVHGKQHEIHVYGRTSTQAQHSHAQEVLDTTYKDLDGLRYTDDELSAEVLDPLTFINPGMVPRFKLYVYYIDRKVVGALLVERYHQFDTQALVERSGKGAMGTKHIIFDRLWVAAAFRRSGFARELADAARTDFIPGMDIAKKEVAMPEQTEMGRGFARRYFI